MHEVEPIKSINFSATGVEEILQNVAFILSTPLMSCPLDREFGIDQSVIDSPVHIAKAKYTANIIDAITKYEPRVIVSEVNFTGDPLRGKLTPKVRLVINDEI